MKKKGNLGTDRAHTPFPRRANAQNPPIDDADQCRFGVIFISFVVSPGGYVSS